MRLSRLSDRQLRRLIRNAEVRFGNEFGKDLSRAIRYYIADMEVYLNNLSSNKDYKRLMTLIEELRKKDPKLGGELWMFFKQTGMREARRVESDFNKYFNMKEIENLE